MFSRGGLRNGLDLGNLASKKDNNTGSLRDTYKVVIQINYNGYKITAIFGNPISARRYSSDGQLNVPRHIRFWQSSD